MNFNETVRMKTARRTFMSGVIALMLGISSSAQAELSAAQGAVEGTVNEVLEIIYGAGRGSSLSERELQVERALGKTFAYDVFVGRALGRNRSKLTDAQFKSVSELTVRLMVKTYVKQFAGAQRPTVVYGSAKDLGGHQAELSSTVTLGSDKFDVRYRSAKLVQGWRVYDILIEGVSLVSNYRKQFDSHFNRGDAAGLISKLESQLAD
jgi:phospholipid transport system substrate-binding protein